MMCFDGPRYYVQTEACYYATAFQYSTIKYIIIYINVNRFYTAEFFLIR